MNVQRIVEEFRAAVCQDLQLIPEGVDRYRVSTPFVFDDGDCLSIFLKKSGDRWQLTDEGHTYMHMSYWMDESDLKKGQRNKLVRNALSSFSVSESQGSLVLPVADEDYGNALFSMIQTILKISDVAYLSRERVQSTFLEDFRSFFESLVPADRRSFQWRDPEHDKEGRYQVDCRINSMATPLYVFALNNDQKVSTATITLHQFEKWGRTFDSIGIFENQEEIGRDVVARWSDICGKQFSSLTSNTDRITKFVQNAMS